MSIKIPTILEDGGNPDRIPVWVVLTKLTHEPVKVLYRRSRPFSWEAWAVYAGITVDEAVELYTYVPTRVLQEQIDYHDNMRLVP